MGTTTIISATGLSMEVHSYGGMKVAFDGVFSRNANLHFSTMYGTRRYDGCQRKNRLFPSIGK